MQGNSVVARPSSLKVPAGHIIKLQSAELCGASFQPSEHSASGICSRLLFENRKVAFWKRLRPSGISPSKKLRLMSTKISVDATDDRKFDDISPKKLFSWRYKYLRLVVLVANDGRKPESPMLVLVACFDMSRYRSCCRFSISGGKGPLNWLSARFL